MSFTAEIYENILADIRAKPNGFGSVAMRMVQYENGMRVAFSINKRTEMRAIYFTIGNSEATNRFPHWQGVNIDIIKLPDYGTDQRFFALTQLPQSEGYIFEIVAEDLRKAAEKAESTAHVLGISITILEKWKDFFQSEKEVVMSAERQQGLYGELRFLEESLGRIGSVSISNWAGSNDETHDFYFASNAVEVKTTSRQSPYFAHISSEYQLDDKDVSGCLFVKYYALRKSQSTGDTLPAIVDRIRNVLSNHPPILQQFREKLNKYGYLDEVAEQYTAGYYIRDEYIFRVNRSFPRVIRSDLQLGVMDIVYIVSIAQCMPYIIESKYLWHVLKGGPADAE